MDYEVIATEYGPEIRFQDWRAHEGYVVPARGEVQIHAPERAHVIHEFCGLGGGGDLEREMAFRIDRLGPDGRIDICFNRRYRHRRPVPNYGTADPAKPAEADAGFRLEVTSDRVRLFAAGDEAWARALAPGDLERPHTFKLAVLLWDYEATFDGERVAEGPWALETEANEGLPVVLAEDAQVTITDFAQRYIRRAAEYPDWRRAELLYEEPFGADSYEKNWLTNGVAPTIDDEGFTFNKMSNNFLRRRFDGPVAVECVATPEPSPKHSSIVTDAIFLWMADKPDGDFLEHMANLEDAGLNNLRPLNLYWVDFGGSNNVTTRLRRNPGRMLFRQFSDRAHLLTPGATYRVMSVANGNVLEFWVNGERWIQTWDPEPHTSGFCGFRAFAAGIRVTELKVWSISS